MNGSDLLLIVEHVNILKTVFQEISEGWREGKVVLLVFQNPHQRRYCVLRYGKYISVDWEYRFNRKDNDCQFSRLGFYITAVNILRVDEGPLCV